MSGQRITEADFQRTVVDAARTLGWQVYHTTYSVGSDRGYPDLTLAHPNHGMLWLELKGPRGKVYPEQQEWIDFLNLAGQKAYILRWDQWDVVEALLKGEEVSL